MIKWAKSQVRQEKDKFKRKNQHKDKLIEARNDKDQEQLDKFWEVLTNGQSY